MRVVCRHGHFAFYPRTSEDIGRFQQYYQTELVAEADYFTFPELVGLPRYSILARPYGNLIALATYEGRSAWEVMRENGFVYDVTTALLLPKLSVTNMVKLPQTTYYSITQRTLVQPGALTVAGTRILSYDAEFSLDWKQLRIRSTSVE